MLVHTLAVAAADAAAAGSGGVRPCTPAARAPVPVRTMSLIRLVELRLHRPRPPAPAVLGFLETRKAVLGPVRRVGIADIDAVAVAVAAVGGGILRQAVGVFRATGGKR